MRQTRVYIDQPIQTNLPLTLDKNAARHLTQVLRLKAGAQCQLFNGNGYDFAAEIISIKKNSCTVRVLSQSDKEALNVLETHLAIGISRGERMDYAIQKSVELGVNRITPLFTKRTQVSLAGDRLQKRLKHWKGVIISACEQSGRRYIPALNQAQAISDWLLEPHANGLILDHRSKQSLSDLTAPSSSITLLIGPEGGLTEQERELAMQSDFTGIRLGPRVMRTETAPIAALAGIQTLWGDFR